MAKDPKTLPKGVRYPSPDIGEQMRAISPQSVEIVEILQENGFEAYMVGGCVRDLLLDRSPKDFDVATNAEPGAVTKLFKRSRIVGRRFQIVHVRNGREVVEVTTFRAHHDTKDTDRNESEQSDSGMLLRDNVYGSLADDAMRRDFTINALYFCPKTDEIIDFVDAMPDIKAGVLRVIGDASTRYQEDPVRMLRAARFTGKLGFEPETKTAEAITRNGHLLRQVAPARMFDEVLKLFMGGAAATTLKVLQQYDLLEYLFPLTAEAIEDEQQYAQEILQATMENTDARIQAGKPVTPAFMYAAVLWPAVIELREACLDQGMHIVEALREAAHAATMDQLQTTAIPKRFSIPMREIWDLQSRLHLKEGKRAAKLRSNPRFRAAYDFVLLREQAGEDMDGLGEWWTTYQEENPVEEQARPQTRKPPRRRRRRPPRQEQGQPPS
ncbi:MAG: polynucleotide adenylyltransferase PcnB [Pseudomonadales bacterium]